MFGTSFFRLDAYPQVKQDVMGPGQIWIRCVLVQSVKLCQVSFCICPSGSTSCHLIASRMYFVSTWSSSQDTLYHFLPYFWWMCVPSLTFEFWFNVRAWCCKLAKQSCRLDIDIHPWAMYNQLSNRRALDILLYYRDITIVIARIL